MTIALGIRVRRDALEVEIIEFSIDLKPRSKCLSFMSRVKVGIQSEGILQIVGRTHFPGPIVNWAIVLVVSRRCRDADTVRNVTV